MQPATARFYRLPDLLHLPGSDGAIGHPRNKATATGHVTKLPRQEDGRGWEPAYGTEETVAFMAAVAVKETVDVQDDRHAPRSSVSNSSNPCGVTAKQQGTEFSYHTP